MIGATLLLAASALVSDAGGVWKGHVSGEGYANVPLPMTLWLEPYREGRVRGRVRLQGFGEPRVTGTFDEESGRLEVGGIFSGGVLRITATLEDERFVGEVTDVNPNLAFEAERLAPESLAEPEVAGLGEFAALGAEAWLEDLAFLAEYLPQVHADPFHTISRRSWERAVGRLADSLSADEFGSMQIVIELARLVASVGDAHTELDWREALGVQTFDVELIALADGFYDVRREARVVRFGDLPIEEALERTSSVFAVENDAWRRQKAASLLPNVNLVWAMDVVSDRSLLALELETLTGESVSLQVTLAPTGGSGVRPELPLWRRRMDENYWFEALPDARAVYFAFNRCAEDANRPMGPFLGELLRALESSGADRLVIDLRHNSGGNSAVLANRMDRIFAHPSLADGSVVALIGGVTYSSGMMNALQLRERGATLVGEPTGGRPNSYGELRSFRLPRSGLRVNYSTKYFPLLEDDDPPSVEPDELVPLTGEDWFGGRDPVLDAALSLR